MSHNIIDKIQPIMPLVNVRRHRIKIIGAGLSALIVVGCASLYQDYDKSLLENKDYDRQVKIKPSKPETPWGKPLDNASLAKIRSGYQAALKNNAQVAAQEKQPALAGKANAVAPVNVAPTAPPPLAEVSKKHEPDIEPSEGFSGRRPIVDPFHEGEEVTYAASYFAVEAGQVTLSILPFVQVNGKKSYHFGFRARSSSVFSMFYNVDDSAEAFLDYDEMIPYSYTIKAHETKQIRDVKTYFDWKTHKAQMWDKKIKKGQKPEEKNSTWDILPYSQNVLTVAYYIRTFPMKLGDDIAVRVAHEGDNIIMRAKVVREEKLRTPAGMLDTVVIKPQFEIKGVFKPVGDIYIWMTKDDRKMIVRIESKIKIGTVVISAQKIKR